MLIVDFYVILLCGDESNSLGVVWVFLLKFDVFLEGGLCDIYCGWCYGFDLYECVFDVVKGVDVIVD